MPSVSLSAPKPPTAIQTHLAASFVSLELSRSIWLITSLSPGLRGENVEAFRASRGRRSGAAGALFGAQAESVWSGPENPFRSSSFRKRVSTASGFIGCCKAKASIAMSSIRRRSPTSRRRRRAKTDRIDGEALLRALLAYKRGEPRVCAMQ